MLNQIELNMYQIVLNQKTQECIEHAKLLKNEMYCAALSSGMEKVCSQSFQLFLDKFDSIINYLILINDRLAIQHSFSEDDFKAFLEYVTSDKFKEKYMK